MTTCPLCRRPAPRGPLCGPCTVASKVETIGENEGRAYQAQPLMIYGIVAGWEVYEVSSDARRFHCTGREWPKSAACRRIGPVARWAPPGAMEGGEGV